MALLTDCLEFFACFHDPFEGELNLALDFIIEICNDVKIAISLILGMLQGMNFDTDRAHGKQAFRVSTKIDNMMRGMVYAILGMVHLNLYGNFWKLS